LPTQGSLFTNVGPRPVQNEVLGRVSGIVRCDAATVERDATGLLLKYYGETLEKQFSDVIDITHPTPWPDTLSVLLIPITYGTKRVGYLWIERDVGPTFSLADGHALATLMGRRGLRSNPKPTLDLPPSSIAPKAKTALDMLALAAGA